MTLCVLARSVHQCAFWESTQRCDAQNASAQSARRSCLTARPTAGPWRRRGRRTAGRAPESAAAAPCHALPASVRRRHRTSAPRVSPAFAHSAAGMQGAHLRRRHGRPSATHVAIGPLRSPHRLAPVCTRRSWRPRGRSTRGAPARRLARHATGRRCEPAAAGRRLQRGAWLRAHCRARRELPLLRRRGSSVSACQPKHE